jgi:hypothetical protein
VFIVKLRDKSLYTNELETHAACQEKKRHLNKKKKKKVNTLSLS